MNEVNSGTLFEESIRAFSNAQVNTMWCDLKLIADRWAKCSVCGKLIPVSSPSAFPLEPCDVNHKGVGTDLKVMLIKMGLTQHTWYRIRRIITLGILSGRSCGCSRREKKLNILFTKLRTFFKNCINRLRHG